MVPVQAALKWNYTTETIEEGRIYNLSAQGWWPSLAEQTVTPMR
jgi:hypothetical protein